MGGRSLIFDTLNFFLGGEVHQRSEPCVICFISFAMEIILKKDSGCKTQDSFRYQNK